MQDRKPSNSRGELDELKVPAGEVTSKVYIERRHPDTTLNTAQPQAEAVPDFSSEVIDSGKSSAKEFLIDIAILRHIESFKEDILSRSKELTKLFERTLGAEHPDLPTVSSAIDLAVEELLRSFGNVDCIKESQVRVKTEPYTVFFRECGSFKLDSDNASPFTGYSQTSPPFQGAARHGHGAMDTAPAVGIRIFSNIAHVSSLLLSGGYAGDVVIASILLHTHNSLDDGGTRWLHNQAKRFSPRVQELVHIVQGAKPDPLQTPELILPVNFQHPVTLDESKASCNEALNQAKAIAVASMIQLAEDEDYYTPLLIHNQSGAIWETNDPPLEIRYPWLKHYADSLTISSESHIPHLFKEKLQRALQNYAEKNQDERFRGLHYLPLRTLRAIEIRSSLDLFRQLFRQTPENEVQRGAFACVRHAANLMFHLISDQAPLGVLADGLTHPSFDVVSPQLRQRLFDKCEKISAQLRSQAIHSLRSPVTQAKDLFSHHSPPVGNADLRKDRWPSFPSDSLRAGRFLSDLDTLLAELGPASRSSIANLRADCQLSQASAVEAQEWIDDVARTLKASIPSEQHAARTAARFYSTLQFDRPSREERCEALFSALQHAPSAALTSSKTIGLFIEEKRTNLVRQVRQLAEKDLANKLELYRQHIAASPPGATTTVVDPLEEAASAQHDKGTGVTASFRQVLLRDFGHVLQKSIPANTRPHLLDDELLAQQFASYSDEEFISHVGKVLATALPVPQAVVGLELRAKRSGAYLRVDESSAEKRVAQFLYEEVHNHLQEESGGDFIGPIASLLRLPTAGNYPEEETKLLYSADELRKFSRAIDKMMEVCSTTQETGNLRSMLESFQHELEVGIILALVGAPADVVIVGILHDYYESTASKDLQKAAESRREAETWVRSEFGEEIHNLIELISETRVSEQGDEPPFLERKMKIFSKMEQSCKEKPDLARKAVAILLAAKVSTLGEGLIFFDEHGRTEPWSGGDYHDNLRVMVATRELAERLSSNRNLVTELFDDLLCDWGKRKWSGSDAIFLTADKYSHDADPQVKIKGVGLLHDLAMQGHIRSKAELGLCYLQGRGIKANTQQGIALIKEALEKWRPEVDGPPDPDHPYYLAMCFEVGLHEVTHDLDEALAWYTRASEEGSVAGSFRLARLCIINHLKDNNAYRDAYTKACQRLEQRAGPGNSNPSARDVAQGYLQELRHLEAETERPA